MHDLYSLLSGLAKPERRKQFFCFARPSERDTVLPGLVGWLGGWGMPLQVDPSNYALNANGIHHLSDDNLLLNLR